MKLTDVVKRYSGEPGQDVEQWLDRFDVAIELIEKPADDKAKSTLKAQFVPLLLDEPAYSTWQQLKASDKKDFATIATALRRVFGKSITSAWQELKAVRLFPGEPVDVLVSRIQRLLSTVAAGAAVPEQVVSVHLIDALPPRVAEQVRLQHGEHMTLTDVSSCAKSLLSGADSPTEMTAGAARAHHVGSSTALKESPRCYGCGRVGHTKRNCRVSCFGCQERGHIQRNCPLLSGNGRAEAAVPDPAVPASTH